jgi:hypothetical protein
MKPTRKSPWNWLTFLNRAVKKEPSEDDYYTALELVKKWPACACGQLCRKLPKNDFGSPLDFRLKRSGLDFSGYVERKNWKMALFTFHAIEARTAELLGTSNP